MTRIKLFCAHVVTTNGIVLTHAKSFQIYLFSVKRHAKTTFQMMLRVELAGLVGLDFKGPVNTIKAILSRST